jgi:uncharacterized protein YxeA
MSRPSALALALALVATTARADDKEIPLDKAPPGAAKAVKAKYPKAQITRVEQEDDDGQTVFEFTLKDGDRKLEAEFTADGKFVKSEEEITEKEIPQAVMAAFRQKYPAAKPAKLEKVTKGDGAAATVVYEFDFKDGDTEVEAYFSPDGKFVEQKDSKKGEKGKKMG